MASGNPSEGASRAGLPGGVARLVYDEQFAANQSSLAHFDAFASHRSRLTRLLAERAPPSGSGRLCVLGAGNCHDLDLSQLLRVFEELHLVDLDEQALACARDRLPEAERGRVVAHAPIDLSGMLARLTDWKARRLRPEDVVRWPQVTAAAIARAIGHRFEVVASTCLLSQMQLGLVQALGDQHPFFQAARYTVNVTHLRTLCRLLAPGGRAVLATDVVADPDLGDREFAPDEDLRPVLQEQARQAKLMYATHPALLRQIFAEDPVLRPRAVLSDPIDAWLWTNGPVRTFLVYAVELRGRPAQP